MPTAHLDQVKWVTRIHLVMTLAIEQVFNCIGASRRGRGCAGSAVSDESGVLPHAGHPVRIRVLELLGDGPLAVRDLLADVEIEASSLSQQLAVLRRAGIVTSTRQAGT